MLMLSFGCHFYCYYINKRPSRQYTAVTAIVITQLIIIIRGRLHGCSIDHFLDPVKKPETNVIYRISTRNESREKTVTAKKKKWLTKFKGCYSSKFQCLTKSTKGPILHIAKFVSRISAFLTEVGTTKLFHNFINVP
jgi:hypothetical protein